ncbi:MAG: hypothetical protein AAF244_03840 [Pseudomonadota bacterium]
MVLPGSNNHQRSGILPPAELTQEFLGAQFFFDSIFTNPRTGEVDINYFLDMPAEDLEKLNQQMHDEAALHEDSIERHIHISYKWSILSQYFAKLASKDGLTGIFNKRAFADTLKILLDRYNKFEGQDRRELYKNYAC